LSSVIHVGNTGSTSKHVLVWQGAQYVVMVDGRRGETASVLTVNLKRSVMQEVVKNVRR